jgi:hypothetical protein
MFVEFEVTVQEGWADKLGKQRKRLSRSARMDNVPILGDTIETGYGTSRVAWVDWSPWAPVGVFIRLSDIYTLSEPFNEQIAALREIGWK